MKSLTILAAILLVFGCAWAQDEANSLAPLAPQAWQLKAGFADMGDFGNGFSAAVDYNMPKWNVSAGWASATAHLSSTKGNFDFDGNYYFIETSYLYRPAQNPLMYFGLGPGWYRVDGDFKTTGSTQSSTGHDNCLAGHVVVGTQSANREWFGEVRWVFGTKHFDAWNSDGLRVYLGYRF